MWAISQKAKVDVFPKQFYKIFLPFPQQYDSDKEQYADDFLNRNLIKTISKKSGNSVYYFWSKPGNKKCKKGKNSRLWYGVHSNVKLRGKRARSFWFPNPEKMQIKLYLIEQLVFYQHYLKSRKNKILPILGIKNIIGLLNNWWNA